jgi:hypothetical protein
METNKIGLAFSDFSMVFYGFSKLQPKTTKGERIHLLTGPWKGFGSHTCTLGLHKRPWKKKKPCNVAHGAAGGEGGRIPASSPLFLAAEAAGEDHMLTRPCCGEKTMF